MVSEPLQDPLGHRLSSFPYQTTDRLCPRTKPNSASREGCVKSPTSDSRLPDNVFISGEILTPQAGFVGLCWAQPRLLRIFFNVRQIISFIETKNIEIILVLVYKIIVIP